jgi:hypothetical protein
MASSVLTGSVAIQTVETTDTSLSVSLSDGRVVTVPISWYPRLSHARPEHRARCELVGQGHGIHWPELDEDISLENILFGQPSGEAARSFARWKEWYQEKPAGQTAAPKRDEPAR